MTYEITKTFRFSASHRLTGLEPGHKCLRLHGHNFRVTVLLRADDLTAPGMVKDYGDLAPFAAWLDENWDHRHLGYDDLSDENWGTEHAVVKFNPTAENLAGHLLDIAVGMFGAIVAAVTVQETENTSATATR